MNGNLTEQIYFIGEGTMRFGITITTVVISLCLNFQLGFSQDTLVTTQWPHITRTTDFQTSVFQGRDCDDTEYRNHSGLPAWKNYGGWLSECDSLSDTYHDSVFAVQSAERREKERIEREKMLSEPLEELDLDAMWDNTVWNEIVDIGETTYYETENITAVAGVRGAEAEDEALNHLYYRRSMKGIAQIDLQKALGKLMIKREKMPDDSDTKKIDSYIYQLKIKLKKV